MKQNEYHWIKAQTPNELKREYRKILPRIRRAARVLGYAIGLHGSMRRDLDLIAVPWVRRVATQKELVNAIQLAVSKCREAHPEKHKRPHGRTAYIIHVGRRAYIDLSVTGTIRKASKQ